MWATGDEVSFNALTARRPAHLAQCSEVLIVRCGEGGSEEGGLWSETRAQWEAPSEMSDWPSCTFQLYSVQLQDLSGRYEPWPGIYTLLSCTDNRSSLESAYMRSIRIIWIWCCSWCTYHAPAWLVSGLAAVSWPSLTRAVSGRRRGQDEEMFTFVCNMQPSSHPVSGFEDNAAANSNLAIYFNEQV